MLDKNVLYYREKIPKYTRYANKPTEGRHLVKYENKKEYEYYKCDYCNDEIIILKDHKKMTGGTVVFPKSLTKKKDLELVLCNKCLNAAIIEFEQFYV